MPTRPTIIGQLASLSFGQLASSIERIWCIQTCFSILSFDNSFKTSFKNWLQFGTAKTNKIVLNQFLFFIDIDPISTRFLM
jgi:hypothetical protein